MNARWGNRGLGAAAVLLGTAVVIETQGLAAWDDFGPGPRFFPLVGAALMVVFGLAIAIDARAGAVSNLEREVWLRVARYGFLLVVCVVLLKAIGALAAFALFFLLELRWVEKYGWTRSMLLALVNVGVLYAGFVYGLQVRLPPMPFLQ